MNTDAGDSVDCDVPRARSVEPRWRNALVGFAMGGLIASVLVPFKLDARNDVMLVLLGATLGAALGSSRFRKILLWAGELVVAALLVIGATPLVPWLTRLPPVADALSHVPAIVILGAGDHSDATLTSAAQDRLDKALELMREGYSDRLLVPGSGNPWLAAARKREADLRLPPTIEEAPSDGPVRNTHDEAVAVARTARAHHWSRVILVTHAWHMERSAAVFEKAGIHVLRAPCDESSYDAAHPVHLTDRCIALHYWLHETIGCWVYRWRSWM